MKYWLLTTLLLTGCTYSINMVHTQGKAKDVVDEQQTPAVKVETQIPITPGLLP